VIGRQSIILTTLITELLKLLQEWRKEGARVNGFGLREALVDDDKTPVEWFILDGVSGADGFEVYTWNLQEPILDDDIHLKVKADRMKPGVHVAGWTQLVYVSERFKAVVEAHRLTGIEFVWCRDVGKYRALQWYLPICQKFLGRGLDHPWIDTAKLRTIDPRSRRGQDSALAEYYKRDAGPADPDLQKVLRLLRSMEMMKRPPDFDSFPRFLRRYLPDTDFAFTIKNVTWDEKGSFSRHRGLAMNRKARNALKANRIVTDELCDAVLILERPPKGVENLDRRFGPAEPGFSPEQMARISELEAAAWAKHLANPKPSRAPDLARSLGLLRSRKRYVPTSFARPATPKAIGDAAKALEVNIPAAWQKALRISNGGKIDNNPLASGYACLIIPAEKLAKSRQEEVSYYRDLGTELGKSQLVVMQTEVGDSIWLDTGRRKRDDDCRVVLMSHETGEEQREWLSIADFLEELLTAEGD
jgi:hypothetical protein